MYELTSGRNKFAEWTSSEDIEVSDDNPLKTSTFRIQPDFEEEIMEFIDRFDTPFNSRSELVRISCRLMIDTIQNGGEGFPE
jgi:hypothetical protein